MGWWLPIHLAWLLFAVVAGRLLVGGLRVLKMDPAKWVRRKFRLSFAPDTEAVNETIRWGIITAIIALGLIGLYGTKAALAHFGPHEGDQATSDIVDIGVQLIPRDPKKDSPTFVNVRYRSSDAISSLKYCSLAFVRSTLSSIDDNELNFQFSYLVAESDLMEKFHSCDSVITNKPVFNSLFPSIPLSDHDVGEIIQGTRTLYVGMMWRYHDPRGAINIQEFCQAYTGGYAPANCPGDHNSAFVHMSQ